MAAKNTAQVKLTANPLRITTLDGFPDGMNVNDPAQELLDTEARYLQDVFVHQLGFTRRRGPLADVPGMVSWGTDKLVGLVQTRDPSGTIQVGALHVDTGNNLKFSVISSDFSSKTLLATLQTGVSLTPYPIVDAKPAKNGGSFIGISAQDGVNPSWELLVYWRGGVSASYNTGTITTTSGSASVAGSGTTWVANVSAGMFLLDGSNQPIGVVKTVNSNTSITLEEPAQLIGSGISYVAQALRGYAARVTQGEITCDTTHATVTGANTKFQDEGVAANWRIFRASDGVLVGTVTSVQSNKALTLTGNAAVALSNEDYYAVSNTLDAGTSITDSSKHKPGFLNAAYADRQFFANRGIPGDAGGEWINRLWFSEVSDPEDIDMSTITGNYIPIVSGSGNNTPVKAIVPAYNSMVILKQDESFILVGQDENQFQLKKLGDDGTLSGMSAVAYNGGVLWAGKNGIYFYDGVTQTNIVQGTLGLYYSEAVHAFDPNTYRMWGTVIRDHYFLHIESVQPPVAVIKGNVSATPTRLTIVIYLPRNAVTVFTNFNIRGGLQFTNGQGQQAWVCVNTSTEGHIVDMNTVFDSQGIDTISCDVSNATESALTVSGNEITDTTRAANIQGDGAAIPGGYGIWEATTNSLSNGGLESNTTGWNFFATAGGTLNDFSRSTVDKKFGTASLHVKWTNANDSTSRGVLAFSASPGTIAVSAGQSVAASCWIKIISPGNNGFHINVAFWDSGGSQIGFTSTAFPSIPTNVWTNVSHVVVAPANSAHVSVQFETDTTTPNQVIEKYLDGMQLEVNNVIATPYVETNGATATRLAARVQADPSLLTGRQGWVAVRAVAGSNVGNERFFSYTDGTLNNRIELLHGVAGTDYFNVIREAGGVAGQIFDFSHAYTPGSIYTLVCAWDSGEIRLSINGGAFNRMPDTHLPVGLNNLDIGSALSISGGGQLNGTILWMATGNGILTQDTDAATINTLAAANTGVSELVTGISRDAAVTGVWRTALPQFDLPIPPSRGPDLYIESKKYSAGNGLTLKSWKELLMHYLSGGDQLKLDTVTGLNEVGATSVTEWPVSDFTWDTLPLQETTWDNTAVAYPTWDSLAVERFVAKRIKFLKRNQYLGFRIYQASQAVTSASVGAFALAYKIMRIGRV